MVCNGCLTVCYCSVIALLSVTWQEVKSTTACSRKGPECVGKNGRMCTSCLSGFKGLGCTHVCAAGRYGINCRGSCNHCPENKCNPFNGHCLGENLDFNRRKATCGIVDGRSQYSESDCRLCGCGCDTTNLSCISCTAMSIHKSSQSASEEDSKSSWLRTVILTGSFTAIIVLLTISIAINRSTLRRRLYVREIFNRLIANNTLHIKALNPESGQRVISLTNLQARDQDLIMEELNHLLGQNEEYEDFIQSPRFRELRVAVANMAWNVAPRTYAENDEDIDAKVPRWKYKFLPTSSESTVDPESFDLIQSKSFSAPVQSILKNPSSGQSSKLTNQQPPPGSKPNPLVRFSSAASMVIYPNVSPAGSQTSTDRDWQNLLDVTNGDYIQRNAVESPSNLDVQGMNVDGDTEVMDHDGDTGFLDGDRRFLNEYELEQIQLFVEASSSQNQMVTPDEPVTIYIDTPPKRISPVQMTCWQRLRQTFSDVCWSCSDDNHSQPERPTFMRKTSTIGLGRRARDSIVLRKS